MSSVISGARKANGWNGRPLKYFLERNDSGVWGGDSEDGAGTPVVRSTDIGIDGSWSLDSVAFRELSEGERRTARLRRDDLVVVKSSGSKLHLGKAAIVSTEVDNLQACFSNFVQRLRTNDQADPRYVWYLLNSVGREEMLFLSSTTTGLQNLNGEIIGRVIHPGPELTEQQAIADFLDGETSRIDALNSHKRDLAVALKTRFRSHRRHLLLEVGPSAGSRTRLKYLTELPNGGIWGSDPASGELDVTCYRAGDLDRFHAITVSDKAPTRSISHAELLRFQLRGGDLVLEKSGGGEKAPVGFVARYTQSDEYAVCSNFMARLRPRPPVSSLFLVHVFGALYDSGFTWSFIKQTTGIQNLDAPAFLASECFVPGSEEQHRIALTLEKELNRISEVIGKLNDQIAALQEHKQALITAAVTGQIDIPSAA